jgi:hypothetical protein
VIIARIQAFDADQNCVLATGHIVLVYIGGLKDCVEKPNGVQIARVDAKDYRRFLVEDGFSREFVGIELKKGLVLREQILFRWENRGVVVQTELIDVLDGTEGKLGTFLLGTHHAIGTNEIVDERTHFVFRYDL